jgi:hypothetical protein
VLALVISEAVIAIEVADKVVSVTDYDYDYEHEHEHEHD